MNDVREAERQALFERFGQTKDPKDRNLIVESFAPLAEFFAGRYRNRGADSEDLRQVAQLALVKAVDRFDPDVGVQFSTFAGRTIDGELKRFFRDKTWAVRVPRSLKEVSIEVRRTADTLTTANGKAPTVAQLAAETGYDEDTILEALNVQSTAYRADSLSAPSGSDDARTLGDSLPSKADGVELSEIQMVVQSMLATLPDRERTILVMRFFEERSQQEIAEAVGLSQMHVSRILRKTLEGLREQLR